MILFGIFLILVLLYLLYGRFYAAGMAEYAMFNNTPPSIGNRWTKPESCLQSIKTEWKEFVDAIMDMQVVNSFLELCDVIHALTKYVSIEYIPSFIYCSSFYWSIVFYTNLPVTIKLGYRYRANGCIRNHTNKNNCGHTCNYGIETICSSGHTKHHQCNNMCRVYVKN